MLSCSALMTATSLTLFASLAKQQPLLGHYVALTYWCDRKKDVGIKDK